MKNWIEKAPEQLRLAARPMEISKGQHLFRFGDEVSAVYRILEGEVNLTRFSPEGGEIVLYRAREGDLPKALEGLTRVTVQCVACHATYRIH